MLTCEAPNWVIKIFEYLELDMITQEIVNEAMNWLLSKSIIICNEVI